MSLPQQADQHGAVVGRGSQRSVPTPFLTKTYQLVNDRSTDDVISWNDDGSSFVVWNPTVYARDLLPKHFKHNNLSSFVRQLNTYGFKKLAPDRWEFCNEFFQRGKRRLLCEIQRRKIPASSLSEMGASAPAARPPHTSLSSSGDSICGGNRAAEIMDENERLRKENAKLSEELARMKTLCSNIYNLVIQKNAGGGSEGDRPAAKERASNSEESSTRLFGVAIGMKRGRGDGVEGDVVVERRGKIKSEKLDCSEEEPWMRRIHHHRSNQEGLQLIN